jgi:hypothetical protein
MEKGQPTRLLSGFRVGQDRGIDENNVTHRHEHGQTGDHFRLDIGISF